LNSRRQREPINGQNGEEEEREREERNVKERSGKKDCGEEKEGENSLPPPLPRDRRKGESEQQGP